MDKELEKQLVAILEKNSAILEKMSDEKAAAATSTGFELHGVGSIFGSHSIERDVMTAHIRPFGLGARLPKIPTVFQQPFFSTLTGFTATTGAEAATPCADNPYGYLKGCDLTAMFGRVARDTNTIEINEVMLRRNRGDFTDLILHGSLLGETGFVPAGMDQSQILNLLTKAEMLTAVINLERVLCGHLWSGSPANNNVGGGYKEFPGLANQIATGQVDAHVNQACPALDSDVKDFGNNDICGTTPDIVEYVSMLEAYLYYNADRMGMLPWTAVLSMPPEMWYVLTECWPCAYNTLKCERILGGNAEVNVEGTAMINMRDAMRAGMFIDINGRRYPVVTDTCIPVDAFGLGSYRSSIFFVPLTVAGGFPVTYIEHVDYRAAQPDANLLRGTQEFWTDDGRYYWAVEYQKWCYKLSVKTEQRVVLRTPHLAGRIDNIVYEPLQHFRSHDPDSPYFADGGVSLRPDETVYAVWL